MWGMKSVTQTWSLVSWSKTHFAIQTEPVVGTACSISGRRTWSMIIVGTRNALLELPADSNVMSCAVKSAIFTTTPSVPNWLMTFPTTAQRRSFQVSRRQEKALFPPSSPASLGNDQAQIFPLPPIGSTPTYAFTARTILQGDIHLTLWNQHA